MSADHSQTLNAKNKAGKKARTRRHRVVVDAERCKGCGLCVEVCHGKVLVMADSLNSRGAPFARTEAIEQCGGCLLCALICPDAAIEIEREED